MTLIFPWTRTKKNTGRIPYIRKERGKMCCKKFVKGEVCLSEDTYIYKLSLKKQKFVK